MSVIIRLQNLPLTANSVDIRNFFRGLSIPDGGVHIVGGAEGDAFIAFSTDEDARQGMQLTGKFLKDAPVKLLLSSRNEMYKVIEQARQQAMGMQPSTSSGNSPDDSSKSVTSSVSQNPPVGSTLLGANMGSISLGVPNTNVALGVGFPTLNSGPNSSLPFTLGGQSGISPARFSTVIPGQGNGNLQGLFGPVPPQNVPSIGQSHAASSGQRGVATNQNPFSVTPGSGPTIPVSFQSGIAGSSLASTSHAASVGGVQSLPMSSPYLNLPGSGGNQFGQLPRLPFLPPGAHQFNPASAAFDGITLLSSSGSLGPTLDTGGALRPNFNSVTTANTAIPVPNIQRDDKRSDNASTNVYSNTPAAAFSNQASNRPDLRGRDKEKNDRNVERRRSQSRSRDRKDGRSRRRSRSRDRRRDRRSEDRSRSSSRDRTRSRRSSRDRDRNNRRRSDASTEDNDKTIKRNVLNGGTKGYGDSNTFSFAKLTGIHKDASYREIRDLIRVDVEGGGEGIVRNFEKGIAFVKLTKADDLQRLLRQSGQKLRGIAVHITQATANVWEDELRASKKLSDRDHRDRDKGDRPRTSRFNGSTCQSRCISIRGLPGGVSPRDVVDKFFQNFDVLDIAVVPDQYSSSSGRTSCTAYIQLDSPASAQNSVDFIVKSTDGPNFVVELCEPEDIQRAKRESDRTGDRDRGATRVLITGVPSHANEKDILDFFSDIGLVPGNVQRNFELDGILCDFNDSAKARRAITKDGSLFGRSPVTVSFWPPAQPNPGPSLNAVSLSSQLNPFQLRGTRPALLGPPPNPGARFNMLTSQNPFQQALNMSSANQNNMPRQMRASAGDRPMRFQSSENLNDRDTRNNQNADFVADMTCFEKPGCVIALGNVPYKSTMDDILRFLQDTLRINIPRNRIIRRYDDNQKPTGDVRVAFVTHMEAKIAVEKLLNKYMWNRPVSVCVLDSM